MQKIQEKYNSPSDINEHLPILYKYAKECSVRGYISSWVLLEKLTNNNGLTVLKRKIFL